MCFNYRIFFAGEISLDSRKKIVAPKVLKKYTKNKYLIKVNLSYQLVQCFKTFKHVNNYRQTPYKLKNWTKILKLHLHLILPQNLVSLILRHPVYYEQSIIFIFILSVLDFSCFVCQYHVIWIKILDHSIIVGDLPYLKDLCFLDLMPNMITMTLIKRKGPALDL